MKHACIHPSCPRGRCVQRRSGMSARAFGAQSFHAPVVRRADEAFLRGEIDGEALARAIVKAGR